MIGGSTVFSGEEDLKKLQLTSNDATRI